jgi:hypothetical protein
MFCRLSVSQHVSARLPLGVFFFVKSDTGNFTKICEDTPYLVIIGNFTWRPQCGLYCWQQHMWCKNAENALLCSHHKTDNVIDSDMYTSNSTTGTHCCFSMAKTVIRTCPSITLHARFLHCFIYCSVSELVLSCETQILSSVSHFFFILLLFFL